MKRINWKNIANACTTFLALTLTQISTTPAQAADYDIGSIHITQPWARATPKGASSGAAYMTITNNGKTPDRVSCVSSDASAQCQIHTMTMENGVMKMRPVEGGLEIKPGETVMLKPSSFHVMLVEPQAPAGAGQDGRRRRCNSRRPERSKSSSLSRPSALPRRAPLRAVAAKMEGHGGMMQMDKH